MGGGEPARVIYITRHAEKPGTTAGPCSGVSSKAEGVDVDGKPDEHSLLVCGWQRAGALATLFAPQAGPPRSTVVTPDQLVAPLYTREQMAGYRTHETILPLSQLTRVEIEAPYAEGEEPALGAWLSAAASGVALVCWEHTAIPTIASAIPTFPGTRIPTTWPDERFDVVWRFGRELPGEPFDFLQIPQLLLAGDRDEPIPTPSAG